MIDAVLAWLPPVVMLAVILGAVAFAGVWLYQLRHDREDA